MKAMKRAKDYEMKSIWNNKLQQLFKIEARRAYERLEDQARVVHQQPLGVGNFNNGKYNGHGIEYNADGSIYRQGIYKDNEFLSWQEGN